MLAEHLGIAAVEDLRDFTYGEGASVRRTATLAPLVLDAAGKGDELAIAIADRAAGDLARLLDVGSALALGRTELYSGGAEKTSILAAAMAACLRPP